MTTAARLGIDIVGFNKTKTAFDSVQRSMNGLRQQAAQIKAVFGGLIGANLLENFISSLVRVNAQTVPVRSAIDALSQSYRDFALRVGDAGMNAALINFIGRSRDAMSATTGLDQALGALLGGAINGLAAVMTEITSRAEAMANMFQTLSTTVRNLGIDTNLAAEGLRQLYRTMTFANVREMLPGSEDVQRFIDSFNSLGSETETAAGKTNLLATAIQNLEAPMSNVAMKGDRLKATFEAPLQAITKAAPPATAKIADMGVTMKGLTEQAPALMNFADTASSAMTGLSGVAEALGSTASNAFSQFLDGSMKAKDAVQSFVSSALQELGRLALSSAFSGLGGLFGGGAPSQQGVFGGLLSSFFNSFAGGFAAGGRIPAGQWGITGERGPEMISGPASVYPMAGQAMMTRGGVQQVHISVSLSEDLRAEIDEKDKATLQQSVRISLTEGARQNKRQFSSNYGDAQVRKF